MGGFYWILSTLFLYLLSFWVMAGFHTCLAFDRAVRFLTDPAERVALIFWCVHAAVYALTAYSFWRAFSLARVVHWKIVLSALLVAILSVVWSFTVYTSLAHEHDTLFWYVTFLLLYIIFTLMLRLWKYDAVAAACLLPAVGWILLLAWFGFVVSGLKQIHVG